MQNIRSYRFADSQFAGCSETFRVGSCEKWSVSESRKDHDTWNLRTRRGFALVHEFNHGLVIDIADESQLNAGDRTGRSPSEVVDFVDTPDYED